VGLKEDRIIAALEPAAQANGFELVDVQIAGTGKGTVVRVFIDRPGLSLDDIAQANNWVGEQIDELDPFRSSYTLEVSSPGIDRPLRTLQHFQRFIGQQALVSTEPGALPGTTRSRWTGAIKAVCADAGEEMIELELADGGKETVRLPFSKIRKAHLKGVVDFSRKNG